MAVTKQASVTTSISVLVATVVPGTVLAIVGSFLTWYRNEEADASRKGADVGGVGIAILAVACLLATAAFIGLKGRPAWLLGLVFVLAMVPAANAGNYIALVEQSDGLSTSEGLYLAVIGSGLAAAGSAAAFLHAQMAGPAEGMTRGAELSEGEAPMSGEPGEPHES